MSHKNNSQLWMVPFADLMTCLVILFLALYGLSFSMKKSDYEIAIANMQKELGDKEAGKKLNELENKVGKHEKEIGVIFEAIRKLMSPLADTTKQKIGFHP